MVGMNRGMYIKVKWRCRLLLLWLEHAISTASDMEGCSIDSWLTWLGISHRLRLRTEVCQSRSPYKVVWAGSYGSDRSQIIVVK